MDIDSNLMLDTFTNIATIAIGYNHPEMIEYAQSEEVMTLMVNRPALGIHPPENYQSMLEQGILQQAPKGFLYCHIMMCGSCSVEGAFKSSFLAYKKKQRGGAGYTDEEISSCMMNEKPGSGNLSILSFKYGFHGRMFGSLSATRSKAIHKLDMPAFDWPCAIAPRYKYPLEEFEEYNK